MSAHLRRAVLISVPLALLAGPAVASEAQQPDLLKSLGDFVLNGLGPARTMEDIVREEREAAARTRARAAEAGRDAEAREVLPAPPPAVAIAPSPDPFHAEPEVVAPAAPPVTLAKVEPARVAMPAATVDIIPPPPRARPQAEAVKAMPVSIALPPPEPLKSRIAATATLDQAIRLGGSSGLYGRRLAVD